MEESSEFYEFYEHQVKQCGPLNVNAKFIMGVNKRAVNLAVKGELGRFPISFSCIIKAFRYRYHLQETSNSLLQEAASVK